MEGNANDSILVRGANGYMRFVKQTAFVRRGTVNLALGTRTTTTLPIVNSNGSGFILPVATSAFAGMLSSADKVKLDGIAVGATANQGTVTSLSSANTYLTIATGTTTPMLTLNAGNSPNQVVVRDGAGNIASSVFSGNLVGNAATATTAANSTLWNGYSHDMNTTVGTSLATTGYLLGVPSGTGLVSKHNQASIRTFLGLGSNAYSSAAFLPLTGGTLTGALNGTSSSFSAGVTSGSNFTVSGAAGTYRGLSIQTTPSSPRWYAYADNSAETGGNTGSNFLISRYNDAGTNLGAVLTMNRATGNVAFSASLQAGTARFIGGGNTMTLQSATGTGNSYIEFVNVSGVRNSYIGHGTAATNDLYYMLPTANVHRFYTTGLQRLGVSDSRVTTEIPFRVNRAGTQLQYTQLDHEAGATTLLSKNESSAIYSQLTFAQGNNELNREVGRFNNDGNLIIPGKVTAAGGFEGNATSASILQTPRLINGVPFNGAADITVSAPNNELIGSNYISGGHELPTFFGSAKLRLQMLNGQAAGMGGWMDALWLSSYWGPDVKMSSQLLFSKSISGKIGFRQQNYDASAWGPTYEIYHSGNFTPGNYLPLSGGTLTGALSGTTGNFSGAVTATGFAASGAAGTNRGISMLTNGSGRWYMYTETSAETGSNVGSNLVIQRYSDTGVALGQALNINRSTGNTTFGGTVAANNQLSVTGPGSNLLLKSTSAAGNNFMEFQTNNATRTAYIGQAAVTNDMYYTLMFNNEHIFSTNNANRFKIANTLTTSLNPLMINTTGSALKLKSTTSAGGAYLEFFNNEDVRNSYIGHGSTSNNDFYYFLPSTSKHLFYTSGISRMSISDDLVGIAAPLRINKMAGGSWTDINHELGATSILSKNNQSTTWSQIIFSQGNNAADRELARFDQNGYFIGALSGTAAVPAFRLFGSTNTGLFAPSATSMAISTNGATAMLLDAARNATFFGNISTASNAYTISGKGVSVNSVGSPLTGDGLALYASGSTPYAGGMPAYGIAFSGTPTFGTHGAVTGDWATYLTVSGANTRGWIFKAANGSGGNVASISLTGTAAFNGTVSVATPTQDAHATTKAYVDAAVVNAGNTNQTNLNTKANVSGQAFTGRISGPDGVENTDYITKQQVPALASASSGVVRMIESANSGIFFNSNNTYLERGTLGTAYAYTIPAGTLAGGNSMLRINLSLVEWTMNASNSKLIYLEFTQGANVYLFPVMESTTGGKFTFNTIFTATGRGGGGLMYGAAVTTARDNSNLSLNRLYNSSISTIDFRQAVTVRIKLNTTTGTEDVSLLPFFIEAADRPTTN